jgi:DNA repair protein RadA/Sms
MRLQVGNNDVPFGTNLLDINVPDAMRRRVKSGIGYFDDIVGGQGFMPSSVTLFTGTPGAGKTTMMLKLADSLTQHGVTNVFNTGEESAIQVKLTAERLKLAYGTSVGQITHTKTLLEHCDELRNSESNKGKDFILIVDSLQTLNDGKYGDHTNGKTAERCLADITDWCKANATMAIIIGQVGKDGNFLGSNVLKHMVDAMVTLTVEQKDPELQGARVLSCVKNRFGSAGTTIWLEASKSNFREIARVGIGV